MMNEKRATLDSMKKNAQEKGYSLCPDAQLLQYLIHGLVTNTQRYGYGSCPCRVASGVKQYDVDIICPCEYRDADVDEFGMCYCGLFVSEKVKNDPSLLGPIPERRPQQIIDASLSASEQKPARKEGHMMKPQDGKNGKKTPVWRCTVCGYLCARELPPPICPICKAKAERFEPFTFG